MKSSAHFLIIFSHLNFVNTFCWATPGSGLPGYWAGPDSACLLAYWCHNGVKSLLTKYSQIRNTKSSCSFYHILTNTALHLELQSCVFIGEMRNFWAANESLGSYDGTIGGKVRRVARRSGS